MYESTADLNEAHYYASLDADMEMAEMRQVAAQQAADFAAGNCWHNSGFRFRAEAFYTEQVGLTQGQMWCCDCKQAVADVEGPDCEVCGLNKYNCMAERGVAPEYGKYAHEVFILPPMVLVSVAPKGGF